MRTTWSPLVEERADCARRFVSPVERAVQRTTGKASDLRRREALLDDAGREASLLSERPGEIW